MAEDRSEKTEAPTSRRRQEAREEGNVAKSMDLTAACTLLVGVLLLNFLGRSILEGMMASLRLVLSGVHDGNPTRVDGLNKLTYFAVDVLQAALLPLCSVLWRWGWWPPLGRSAFS